MQKEPSSSVVVVRYADVCEIFASVCFRSAIIFGRGLDGGAPAGGGGEVESLGQAQRVADVGWTA